MPVEIADNIGSKLGISFINGSNGLLLWSVRAKSVRLDKLQVDGQVQTVFDVPFSQVQTATFIFNMFIFKVDGRKYQMYVRSQTLDKKAKEVGIGIIPGLATTASGVDYVASGAAIAETYDIDSLARGLANANVKTRTARASTVLVAIVCAIVFIVLLGIITK